jgi:hypothetical protein
MNPSLYLSNSNFTPISKVIKDNQIYKDYSTPFSSLGSSIVISGSLSERLSGYSTRVKNNLPYSNDSLTSLHKTVPEKEARGLTVNNSKRNSQVMKEPLRLNHQGNYPISKFPSSTSFHDSKYFNYDYILEVRRRKRLNTLNPSKTER